MCDGDAACAGVLHEAELLNKAIAGRHALPPGWVRLFRAPGLLSLVPFEQGGRVPFGIEENKNAPESPEKGSFGAFSQMGGTGFEPVTSCL